MNHNLDNIESNLVKIKTIMIATSDLVSKTAKILAGYYRNVIYINKPKLLLKYNTVIVTHNGKEYGLDCSTDIETIAMVNRLIPTADSVVISTIDSTTMGNSVLKYNKEDIHLLNGLNLLCHKELAIEYFKTLLYSIAYSDSELLFLCRKNPTISDKEVIDTINVLELLDVSPSQYISETETDDLTIYLKSVLGEEYNQYVGNIRRVLKEYTKNPKSIVINSRSVIIDIYNDVRIMRFYEATEYLSRSFDAVDDSDKKIEGMFLNKGM